MTDTPRVKAIFPGRFRPLLQDKSRYKVFYGGRGGAKSWQFARALLIEGLSGGLRVLCTRETQSSLKASSLQLLSDQINMLGLGDFYQVLANEIRGPKDTLFIFKGLSDPDALKSAESIDRVWIEEGNAVSETRWKKLDFTIRKPGAQIWISFNPELETDFIYKYFVKSKPPPSSVVVKVTYRDNPWLDKEVIRQIDHLRETDYDEYLWVAEGHCKVALEGAVYAVQLRETQREGRITKVPVDITRPVHTFWDLGRGDMTAIWFVQIVAGEYRIVHYYQNNGVHFDHYVAKLKELQKERLWFYGTHWLPHDADNESLASRRTIHQQAKDAQMKVRITPKVSLQDGINAARSIFGQCWFDEEHCSEGINCLRQYHYEVDEDGTRSKNPEHDWSSHGADGFRYLGVALRDEPPPKARPKPRMLPKVTGRTAWLGG